MADNPSDRDPPPPPPRKRGRPKRVLGQPKATRDAIYSKSLRERVRDKVDPDHLIQFHEAILEGKNPVFEKDPDTGEWIRVIQDPNPMAPSPTLQQKIESVRWLAERRDGMPAQSIQIEAEVRQKMEMLGTGIATELLAEVKPQTLAYLQMALAEQLGNIEEAQLIEDTKELEQVSGGIAEVSDETNTNNQQSGDPDAG